MRSSNEKIEFLDTMVSLNQERNVNTDLYTKPTDKHMYINYKSDHPTNVKKSIWAWYTFEKNMHR